MTTTPINFVQETKPVLVLRNGIRIDFVTPAYCPADVWNLHIAPAIKHLEGITLEERK